MNGRSSAGCSGSRAERSHTRFVGRGHGDPEGEGAGGAGAWFVEGSSASGARQSGRQRAHRLRHPPDRGRAGQRGWLHEIGASGAKTALKAARGAAPWSARSRQLCVHVCAHFRWVSRVLLSSRVYGGPRLTNRVLSSNLAAVRCTRPVRSLSREPGRPCRSTVSKSYVQRLSGFRGSLGGSQMIEHSFS